MLDAVGVAIEALENLRAINCAAAVPSDHISAASDTTIQQRPLPHMGGLLPPHHNGANQRRPSTHDPSDESSDCRGPSVRRSLMRTEYRCRSTIFGFIGTA